ncbi:hypothetical protein [Nibrella saemangeumensis]
MKNKAGILMGFVLGLTGFLLLFKVVFLNHIPPEDELAPGMVVLAAILNGVLFAFVGYVTQNYVEKKRS